MSMTITGTIVVIGDTAQVSATFQKRDLVVEYAEKPEYPELISFEVIQDKCGELDRFAVGQQVEVHFNLRGRKWTNRQGEDKYFNTLQAWRLVAQEGGQAPAEKPFPETVSADVMPF